MAPPDRTAEPPRRRPPQPARVQVMTPYGAEPVPREGAVRSVQEAVIAMPRAQLERIWAPDNLELLARGYWAFLRRASLGLIRVLYGPASRTVVLLSRRLPLLRFGAPRYETSSGHGCVTWPIDRGLLVAREGRGRGHLRVCVDRGDRGERRAEGAGDEVEILARVEVRNFYPGLRGRGRFARFGAWLYGQTQLRIHVLVCNAYLRSLPRIDFPEVEADALPESNPTGSPA